MIYINLLNGLWTRSFLRLPRWGKFPYSYVGVLAPSSCVTCIRCIRLLAFFLYIFFCAFAYEWVNIRGHTIRTGWEGSARGVKNRRFRMCSCIGRPYMHTYIHISTYNVVHKVNAEKEVIVRIGRFRYTSVATSPY